MRKDALLRLPAFAGLPHREQVLLSRHTEVVRVAAQQSLLTSVGFAREMVLVVDGELLAPGGRTAVAGDFVGAYGLLRQVPQPFPWRTQRCSTLAFMSRAQTRVLMQGSSAFATALAVSLAVELERAMSG